MSCWNCHHQAVLSAERWPGDAGFLLRMIGTESRTVHLYIITVHLFRASVAERSSGSRLSSEKAHSTWSQPPRAATAASRWRLPPGSACPVKRSYQCERCKTQAWILDPKPAFPAQQQQQPQKKDSE
jgi:hypothetical protein